MARSATVALIGDYSPKVVAHQAIPRALEFAKAAAGADVTWRWFHTRDLRNPARELAGANGIWAVPASPYENATGVFDAIRFARETGRPFLGTCGGFQHALIEFARNVAGLGGADHAETSPSADLPVVTPLACPMVDKTGLIRLKPGSRLREAYGADTAEEGYHCNYGLNPSYREALERAGLLFTAFDENNEVRSAELPATMHPFFVGTLFQPERAALRGVASPLVRSLVAAILAR